MTMFFFAVTGLFSAALSGCGLLPSLRSDTMLILGTAQPIVPWVHQFVIATLLLSVAFLTAGLIGLATLNESRRRYLARLPRWQQWLIWPFHGVAPDVNAPPLPRLGLFRADEKERQPPPLKVALRREWHHLIGIAIFPSVALLATQWFHVPFLATMPCFLAAVLYAMWPVYSKRAPSSFWRLGGFVYLAGGFLAGFLVSFLSWLRSLFAAHYP